jgi:uncharacterized protein YndB with AHSA1/START domain
MLMEFGAITRELHIQATPEVVYLVITSPEHLREWWPDDADFEPTVGAKGSVTFGEPGAPDKVVAPITVVEANPPRRFAFRWIEDQRGPARSRSLLVTFDLEAVDGGTLLRFSETGFRERGWEAAVLEETYADHARGWDHFLPRLVTHAATVGARP